MSTRKIEGQTKTWEEPIGVLRATFCQGTSEVREWLGHVPATLIIGKGYTEEDVKAMVKDMLGEVMFSHITDSTMRSHEVQSVQTGRIISIAAKHGITL